MPDVPDEYWLRRAGVFDEPPEKHQHHAYNPVDGYRVVDDEPPLVDPDAPTDHYRQGDIECIDAIRAALTDEEWRGFCKGNILKYVWREKHKGGNETLVKAQDYLRWAVAGEAEGKR